MAKKTVIALVDQVIAGNQVTCGDLVSCEAKHLNPLIKDGSVDDHKEAVNAALKAGVEVNELDDKSISAVSLEQDPEPEEDSESGE